MIFRLACGDVMPGCTAHFESTDRDELMRDVASHAASGHGITDPNPDVVAAIEGKVAVES